MAKPILMPQIGVSDESAILAEWHVAVGDKVENGQVLFTIETDKSAFEVASDVGGTLLALLCDEGDEISVAAPVCVIGEPGEQYDISALTVEKPKVEAPRTQQPVAPSVQPDCESPRIINGGISPRAKATAAKLGVDPALAIPSGAEGRITERDILAIDIHSAAAQTQRHQTTSPQAEFTDVPHTRIRKTIAKNMLNSLQNIPQLTHHHSFDASALLALRAKCKNSGDERLTGITIGDLVLFAVSRTLLSHANLNSNYYDDYLRVFSGVNLGVAVDTQRGLMVPTIFNADKLSAAEISKELKLAAEACRKGSVDPSKLSGASFTVSNLGALGVEMFTPVINPPQTAILGVCATVNRVKSDGSVYPAMGLSLTYDHRAVDGAPASAFLKELCANLEAIELLCLI
ncbi:MAG: 2-oxo acid dehydrogenase subunit E2 [Oscillospiraceae bacterium]|jgi:pyruvate dehydrogenase E2 component (dihydrolipoamide acetyltransferase)|nr:2-oxo acid dehydrogenase subunit E2 [Oscillospiraceae bacterium]